MKCCLSSSSALPWATSVMSITADTQQTSRKDQFSDALQVRKTYISCIWKSPNERSCWSPLTCFWLRTQPQQAQTLRVPCLQLAQSLWIIEEELFCVCFLAKNKSELNILSTLVSLHLLDRQTKTISHQIHRSSVHKTKNKTPAAAAAAAKPNCFAKASVQPFSRSWSRCSHFVWHFYTSTELLVQLQKGGAALLFLKRSSMWGVYKGMKVIFIVIFSWVNNHVNIGMIVLNVCLLHCTQNWDLQDFGIKFPLRTFFSYCCFNHQKKDTTKAQSQPASPGPNPVIAITPCMPQYWGFHGINP